MRARRRRAPLAVFTSLALMSSCAPGSEIDLGNVSSASSGGSGGGSAGACGPTPCANHTGSKDFVIANAPSDARDRFDRATRHAPGSDGTREPAIVYPSNETMFPINIAHVLHEWSAAVPDALFELEFSGPNTRVSVYTDELRFTPTEEQWDWIAESNRGGRVRLQVTELAPALPDEAWTSSEIALSFSDADIEGAIYYWSTGTEGVMKALIGDPSPIKFYQDPTADKATCVGCHSLSRDGKRMAMGYDGQRLREIAVPDRSLILPTAAGGRGGGGAPGVMPAPKMDPAEPKSGEGVPAAWTTFSPDGELLLVAADGALTLVNSNTGETVGPNAGVVPTPAGSFATHPDWSALGDRVAITLAEKGASKEVEKGSIALLSYEHGVWGSPEILVQNQGGEDNNFFPAFSPDSQFVAYVNCTGKSNDARSAALRLVRVADHTIVELPRLNQRVGPLDGVLQTGNSMPTWAPSTKASVFWLAFSSVRAYATVRAADEKKDQLWLAAIDPSLPDPSYSAFWAPFQNIEHGNHRAFWTHTAEDRQCRCQEVCGDRVDNDCDGAADEAECVSACADREICGDGLDNDCNCVTDDCAAEICDDGLDNDGDDLADDADPSCKSP